MNCVTAVIGSLVVAHIQVKNIGELRWWCSLFTLIMVTIIRLDTLLSIGPLNGLLSLTSPKDATEKYIGRSAIRLETITPTDYADIYEFKHHSHVNINSFKPCNESKPSSTDLTAANSVIQHGKSKYDLNNWNNIQHIIHRVHNHVCRHASYYEFRTLLKRNEIWNEQCQLYLSQMTTECSHCKSTSSPPPNRRVSLSSLNREFNDTFCLVHFFLDSITMLNCMDVASRYSAATIV